VDDLACPRHDRQENVKEPRVLFVGPRRDFAVRPFDGLALRHQRLIQSLQGGARCVGIAVSDGTGGRIRNDLGLEELVEIECPERPSLTRTERVRRLALLQPRRFMSGWESRLIDLVVSLDPDSFVTFGPWIDEELAPVFSRFPCIHLFEEELLRMPDLAPQSLQARLLRRGELMARCHRLAVPHTVIVIAEAEIPYARRRFGSSPRYVTLPQTLPEQEWPLWSTRSHGNAVLSIGNMMEGRNAEMLANVMRVLGDRQDRPSDLQLVVISGAGFQRALEHVAASHSWVRLIPGVESPAEHYRHSRLALVPAGRATGFKATILQAWLCGTPVIASLAAAQTLERRSRSAVAIGESPEEMANQITTLWTDDAALERLAAAGRLAVEHDHRDGEAMLRWRELVLNEEAREPLH
jgi:glycosyltransferase involved in cell wall biosynthesis